MNRLTYLLTIVIFLLASPGCSAAQQLIDPPATTAGDRVSSTMQRYQINQSKHPEAVCNDGSTPVFYHRPGIGEGTQKWVIWFKGGGSCWDRESCSDRSQTLLSSRPWMQPKLAELTPKGNTQSNDGKAGGMLDPDPEVNPDFHEWNHVYMVYCSSDNWAGDTTATIRNRTIYFRGYHIVNAIVGALQDDDILASSNLSEASHILLTGSSAGAQGLQFNLDRLADQLSFADVRGVNDATITPITDPTLKEQELRMLKKKYGHWNPKLDASCIASAGAEPWYCLQTTYMIENDHLATPTFFHQDQRDGASPTGSLDETPGLIRDLLAPLPGVFSPNDGFHIIVNDPRFAFQKIDGHAMADILGNWYFDRPGPKNLIEGASDDVE